MRGVVALAAAISLPQVLNDGRVFPRRNEIVFLTFCVIFVTVVLQGLTLPPLIRRLGAGGAVGQKSRGASCAPRDGPGGRRLPRACS
jgi:monovalent cation/hydrogen antiporter